MRKVLSAIFAILIIVAALSVCVFAEDTEVQFSIKADSGKPGDTVNAYVYLDVNPGTWACRYDVNFDSKALKLKSVENGEVFTDSQFTESLLTNDGLYKYYAQMDGVSTNNEKTGLCLTLTFVILETAENGNYPISLSFPENGDGWFFDAGNLNESYSVSATNTANVTVYESEATAPPMTDAEGLIVDTKPEETTVPVTAVLTDDSGDIVTGSNGDVQTEIIENRPISDIPQYVTDDDGNYVRDEDGNLETYYVDDSGNVIEKAETTAVPPVDNTSNVKTQRLILIIAIILVVIAACVIIAIVTISNSKKKNENNNNDTDKNDING